MKKIIIIFSALFFTLIASSQSNSLLYYYIDGVRLSENIYGSTARSAALGGAMSSIGGDMGSISVNPAGIGVYRTSEFSFTPIYNNLKTTSSYLNTSKSVTKPDFNLGNLGGVFTFNSGNSDGLVSTSLAVGYNMLNNFTNNFTITGSTKNTTQSYDFATNANNAQSAGLPLSDYSENLAYLAVVIDKLNGNYYSLYDSAQIKNSALINQKNSYERSGTSGEYYLGLGFNINNKLYLGATLNIKSSYYVDDITYSESDINHITDLYSYTYRQTLSTWGKGFNFKFGAIFRPVEMLRLGLTIHTPTFTSVNQELKTQIDAYDASGKFMVVPSDNNGVSLDPSTDNYKITTPFRAILGAAIMFQQYGFLSVDYEYADYRAMNFSEGDFPDDIRNTNSNVNDLFRATHNIRFGGEAKISSFYLRGGFAYYASPYANTKIETYTASPYAVNQISGNGNTLIYSGGLGYRTNGFFIDFAYTLLSKDENYYMYDNPNLKPASLSASNGSFMATVGFKF